ncbi:MAG: hypothetical protein CMF61_05750 [Magnetococcales bacterium]|nr:hypothetical protein [Magnetococcales bacterium]
MSSNFGDTMNTQSHQKDSQTGGDSQVASRPISQSHKSYIQFIHNPQQGTNPSYEELKTYLRDAYLGLVPLPLSAENIAKSFSFFKGSAHKQTLKKILSDHNVALNLIPGLKKLSTHENFSLDRLHDYVCLEDDENTIEHLEQRAKIAEQKANLYIEDIFQNPDVVKNALRSVSKKQWGQQLVKPPSNPHLLKATASLPSEDFFKNGMHLAFLEIEPEIYSSIKPEHAKNVYIGFKAKKYLRLLLEIELSLKTLKEKQLNEKRIQDDAKLYRGAQKESLILENEVRKTAPRDNNLHLEEKPEKPSFLQKMIREELGYSASVDRAQVQKILEAAEEILNAPKSAEPPQDFLHKKHPEKQKPVITLDSIDLSSRSFER